MNILTHNQILAVIQDQADRHPQVNSWMVSPTWDAATTKYMPQPCLHIRPTTGTYFKNEASDAYSVKEINIELILVDLVNKGKDNRNDVNSDTFQILGDFITELNEHPYYQRSGLEIVGDFQLENLEEWSDDEANGWRTELTFRLRNSTAFCSLPFAPIPGFSFPGPESTAVTYSIQYLTCQTITGCTTLQNYIQQQIDINLTGGTGGGFSGWTGSSGVNSIIANNYTGNIANGYTAIAAGQANNAGGDYSSIIGGSNNIVSNSGTHALVSGGLGNKAQGPKTIVVGGRENTASTYYSIVVGGVQNLASGEKAFIGNGSLNLATSDYSTILNGSDNLASGNRSFIANGSSNSATTQSSSVLGGSNNLASGQASIVNGGAYNTASGGYSSVGGYRNISSGNYSVVAGGGFNRATNQYSAVGGGNNNLASGNYSFAAGGNLNTAQTNSASVIGGQNNLANGNSSSIIGGLNNVVTGNYSTILGGQNITASQSDTAYVPGLNIGTVGSGTPSINLGLDANGFVVTGTTSYDTYSTGGTYSAGTLSIINNTGGTFSVTGFSKFSYTDASNGITSVSNSNTLSKSVLIPANTLTKGALNIKGRSHKSGTGSFAWLIIYVNTTNSLSGASEIGRINNGGNNTILNFSIDRTIPIKVGSFTAFIINAITGYEEAITNNVSTVTIDWTVDQYIILAVQANGGASPSESLVANFLSVNQF